MHCPDLDGRDVVADYVHDGLCEHRELGRELVIDLTGDDYAEDLAMHV